MELSTSLLGVARIRRGGRVVECGSLENCFGGNPSDGGSNPSPSVVLCRSAGRDVGRATWWPDTSPDVRRLDLSLLRP
jgi:hypothetical protein